MLVAVAALAVGCDQGRGGDGAVRGAAPAADSVALKAGRPARGSQLRCTIVGTEGDDVLHGTDGADVVCGLGGHDLLAGGPGDDMLMGGSGVDTVSFSSASGPIVFRLGHAAVGQGKDVLRGIERVEGSPGNDRLFAATGVNTLIGGGGDDRLVSRDRRPYDVLEGGPGRDLCVGDAGDRQLACRHPLVPSHDRGVPILMYHVIADPAPGTPNSELWVGPGMLREQMRYLDRHGYAVVSLQEVYDYWHGGPLPPKAVVLTFDDGFKNVYTRALPILAAHGWAGTLNLALSHYAQGRWSLSGHTLRALIRRNWELDCHSRTHAYLPGLDPRSLASEVLGARRVLQRTFRVPVSFFAYPSGSYDATVVAAVRRAGFLGAMSTEYGLATPGDLYTLDRVGILRSDRLDGFAAKLRRLISGS